MTGTSNDVLVLVVLPRNSVGLPGGCVQLVGFWLEFRC